MHNYTVKGCSLGLATGIVSSLFDSASFFLPEVFIPDNYFFVLYLFNAVFWGLFGLLAGCAIGLYTYMYAQKNPQENTLWVVFFLIPFCLTYGLMGGIDLPLITTANPNDQEIRYSVLMLLCIVPVLVIALIKAKKEGKQKNFSPLMFLPEVAACCLIFYARSFVDAVSGCLKVSAHISISPILLYGAAALTLYGIYYISAFLFPPLYHRLTKNTVIVTVFLCLLSVLPLLAYKSSAILNKASIFDSLNTASEKKTTGSQAAPPIILIILDALRADRLAIYSKEMRVSPQLQLLAGDSVIFNQCIAPSSWTLPSHASLFTGVYPAEHKCHFKNQQLSEYFETIAESLKKNNYTTAAILSNFLFLHPRFNLDQGFDMYYCKPSIGKLQRFKFRPILLTFSYITGFYNKCFKPYICADDITDLATDAIAKLKKNPFFLCLNYMENHTPYLPPNNFNKLSAEGVNPQLYRLKSAFKPREDRLRTKRWDSFLRSQYDAETSFVDQQVGRLLQRLKEWDIYDSALIVVTSDHGELLGERGCYEHRHMPPLEGLIRIPLIIKFPSRSRTGIANDRINLVDVFPTIFSICGFTAPEGLSGKPYGDAELSGFSEAHSLWVPSGNYKVIYNNEYKYIHYQYGDKTLGSELYNLFSDPKEQLNLALQKKTVASKMREKMISWIQQHEQDHIAPETIKKPLIDSFNEDLKSLGYIN